MSSSLLIDTAAFPISARIRPSCLTGQVSILVYVLNISSSPSVKSDVAAKYEPANSVIAIWT